jgi:hypothetical protein
MPGPYSWKNIFKGAVEANRDGGQWYKAHHYAKAFQAEDDAHDRARGLLGQRATDEALGRAYREAQAQRGRDVQFESDGILVKVKNGYSRKFDRYTTDIILIDPGRPGEHLHYVLDDNGKEIHKRWTPNH